MFDLTNIKRISVKDLTQIILNLPLDAIIVKDPFSEGKY